MTENTMSHHASGVPHDPYTKLADIVLRFASAVEDLLADELAYPFLIGSEALRDRAANAQHPGIRTRDALTGLSGNQIRAVGVQCDLHRGIAALLPVPKVFFAPFPLARTSAVCRREAVVHPWRCDPGRTTAALPQRGIGRPLPRPLGLHRPGFAGRLATRTADYVAIGATAGLRPERKKNALDWDAPYVVRSGQGRRDGPPSETEVVQDMFAGAGLGQQSDLPYKLLSAATHNRFVHAGVSEAIPTGRPVNGVLTRAMHSSPGTTAKVTVLAAIATRTHLRRLAQYANVPEVWVQDRLGGVLAEWCAIGGVSVPE